MTVRELLRRVEEEMLRLLDLRPMALSAEFASVRGSWKGLPVELKARAYSGGPVRYGRCIELWGGELSIGNALLLPRSDLPLPIFGVEVVAPGHGGSIVAADLSPVVDGPSIELPAHELPSRGDPPEWCRRWFSPQALYTRLPLGRLREAERPVLARLRALAGMQVTPDPARAPEIGAGQRAYCAAHLEGDEGMLARIFGEPWAQRFLREVMFPA